MKFLNLFKKKQKVDPNFKGKVESVKVLDSNGKIERGDLVEIEANENPFIYAMCDYCKKPVYKEDKYSTKAGKVNHIKCLRKLRKHAKKLAFA